MYPNIYSSKIFSVKTEITPIVPPPVPPDYFYMAFGTEWNDGQPKGRKYLSEYPVEEIAASTITSEETPVSRNISSVLRIPGTDTVLVGGCAYNTGAFPTQGGRVLKSIDLGETWTWTEEDPYIYGTQVRGLYSDPTSGNIYAVSNLPGVCNVLVSEDNGSTWSVLSSFDPAFTDNSAISSVYRHTNGDFYAGVFPGFAFVPTLQPAEIWKSINGTSWTKERTFTKAGNAQSLPETIDRYGVNRIKHFSISGMDGLVALGHIPTTETNFRLEYYVFGVGWFALPINNPTYTYGGIYDMIEDDNYFYLSGTIGSSGYIWQYTKTFTFVSMLEVYDSPLQIELVGEGVEKKLVFCGTKALGTVSFDESGIINSVDINPVDPDFDLFWENPYGSGYFVTNGFVRL
jgi:hypothetical protein